MGEYDLKKGYGSCDVRQREKIDVIQALSQVQGRTKVLCDLFDVPRSSYHYQLKHNDKRDPERDALREFDRKRKPSMRLKTSRRL